jgi:hypothetical protein
MGRFETRWLRRAENLAALADLPGQWIDKVHHRRPPKTIVLDMDSSESPTYGDQEGSAYNGHFGCTCYHPLFVFNQLGDVERCVLRCGNVHSADGWRALLEPVIARYRDRVERLYFRGGAAFANPEMYEFLEVERAGYTIHLPANSILQRRIGYLLKRPVGRPPHEVRRYFVSFSYRAQSWSKSRRVVAKVEWHPGAQAALMNIADKRGVFREACRVLRPGGLLSLSLAGAGSAGEPDHPLPWATTAAISFLAAPDEIRVETANLETGQGALQGADALADQVLALPLGLLCVFFFERWDHHHGAMAWFAAVAS